MIETYRRLLAILTPSERRRFFLLLGAVFVMGALEAAGVLSIFPFLALLSKPELIQTDERINWAYTSLGFTNPRDFTVFVGFVAFGFVLFGLFVKTLTIYAMTRFAYMRSYSLASRLIGGYFSQPYSWFLQRHSAELGKQVLSEVDNLVARAMVPGIRFIAYLFIIVLIFAFITAVDPILALSAAVIFGGSYALIFLVVRRYLLRIGTEMVAMNSERFRVAQEGLGAVKEVKLMGLEEAYIRRFRIPAYKVANNNAAGSIIGDSPRYILEGIAFGTMLALVLGLLVTGDRTLADILPTLGLFAFAGSRVFPTMQQLYRELAALRFARPLIDTIYADLVAVGVQDGERPAIAERSGDRLPLTRALTLEAVGFTYPGAPRPIFEDLNLTIPANRTIGIVGGSGAGKTTLVDLILGLLSPDAGQLRVDDTPLDRNTMRRWQNGIGYVPQQIVLSDDSIAANIAFGIPVDRIDMEAVARAARIAELHEFVETLPDGYRTTVGDRGVRLSGGQRQRIGIARALYHDPGILVLDEATSALDTLTERAVMNAVHALGSSRTILMIAHRLSTVKDCDVIFVLEHGRVLSTGSYEELIGNSDRFRALAGVG